MRFKLRGKDYEINASQIVSAARGFPPNLPDGRNKYYLSFEGENYPIKQLIHLVTKLPYVAFTAEDAHRILTKLGYAVEEFDEAYEPMELAVQGPAPKRTEGNYLRFAVFLERDEDGFI